MARREVDSSAVPADWRFLAQRARHSRDRLLHPWLRRLALRRVARRPRPAAVLFVCHGNICRSPYAAAAARRLLPSEVAIESSGFVVPDRPAPPEAVAVAAEHGIDLSTHRSKLITLGHLRSADLVLVMDEEQRRRVADLRGSLAGRVVLLGDLDPEAVTERGVPDPLNQPIETFRTTYDRIDRCVSALSGLWSERGGNQPEA
jgi:protein-tyrosine phosphatase